MYCTMKCQWKLNFHVLYHGPINESESESESEFATEWRVSDNRGHPQLVCVHGYTALFQMGVHGNWLKVLTNAHTHI